MRWTNCSGIGLLIWTFYFNAFYGTNLCICVRFMFVIKCETISRFSINFRQHIISAYCSESAKIVNVNCNEQTFSLFIMGFDKIYFLFVEKETFHQYVVLSLDKFGGCLNLIHSQLGWWCSHKLKLFIAVELSYRLLSK